MQQANRNWPRLVRRALALLLAAALLGGCWDREELEDTAFVMMMGLDQGSEEGRVRVTLQIPIPREMGIGGPRGPAGGRPASLVESVEAATVTDALRDLQTMVNRRIRFLHLQALVIGRELAEAGLQEHLGILSRFREMRRTVRVVIADGKAEEWLTYAPLMEQEPATFLVDLLQRNRERGGTAPPTRLHEFLIGYGALARHASVPLLGTRVTDPGLSGRAPAIKPRIKGTALFRGEKMVGELTGDESERLQLLSGDLRTFFESMPEVPGSPEQIALQLRLSRRMVSVDRVYPDPSFTIRIVLEGEIRQIERIGSRAVTAEGLLQLEERLERQIQTTSMAVIDKMLREFRSDAIGLGEKLRPQFWDYPSWERYSWLDRVDRATVNLDVQVRVRQIGMTFQPLEPN